MTWRHLRPVVMLPGTATVLVPAAILALTRSVRIGWGLPPLAAVPVLAVGVVLLGVGGWLFATTVALFAGRGGGTLAPWDPPQRLVVAGPYRYVRNPMISGGLFVLLGEAAILGSPPLLVWAGLFWAVNAVWLPLVEEPALERRFGDDYRAYRAAVGRWLPRRRPWTPVAPEHRHRSGAG